MGEVLDWSFSLGPVMGRISIILERNRRNTYNCKLIYIYIHTLCIIMAISDWLNEIELNFTGLKSKPGADPSAGWNTQIASGNWSYEGRSTVWDSTAPQIGQVISEDESMVLINVERIGYVYIYIYDYILIYVYVELCGCVGWHVKWHFSAACPSSSCRWTDKKTDGFLIIFLSFSYHFPHYTTAMFNPCFKDSTGVASLLFWKSTDFFGHEFCMF